MSPSHRFLAAALAAIVVSSLAEAALVAGGEGPLPVLAVDADFEDRWFHTPGAEVLPGRALFYPGEFFHVALVLPSEGLAEGTELTVDLKLVGPGGAAFEAAGVAVVTRSGKSGMRPALAIPSRRLGFGLREAPGSFSLEAVVHGLPDKAVQATTTLTLAALPESVPFENRLDVGEWMLGYFQDPQPGRAWAALTYSAESGVWDDPRTANVTKGFFRALCERSPFLYAGLIERFSDFSDPTKNAALYVLAQSSPASREALVELGIAQDLAAGMSEGHRSAFEAFEREKPFDAYTASLSEPSHLDHLWAEFFATGRFAPIRRVCELLEAEPEAGEAAGPLPGQPLSIQPASIAQAAKWSIRSNRRFELVLGYVRWIFENEELSDEALVSMKEILGS